MCWKALSESFNVLNSDEEFMPKPLDVLFVTPPNHAQIYQDFSRADSYSYHATWDQELPIREGHQRVIPFTRQRRGAHAKAA